MYFYIKTDSVKEEVPTLTEKNSELLNLHSSKLGVSYIGKSNPSTPAVINS